MSVDYHTCDCCGDSRYEENIKYCEKCGRMICDDCVIGEGDFFDDMINSDGEIKSEHCPFCSGEEVHNDDLLYFALNKLNMTFEELKNEYLNKEV
jgi:hypothetical protein